MYKFLLVLGFLVGFASQAFSEVKAVYMSKTGNAGVKIQLGAETDTVCIINDNYHMYNQKLDLKLDFSDPAHGATGLKWTDEEPDWQTIQTTMAHSYTQGMYKLWIKGQDDKPRLYLVFNKYLTADFGYSPYPFRHCIEDTDSLLLFKQDFDQNIPGTIYGVAFESAPEETEPFCEVGEWFGEKQDSVWIKFNHGTGIKKCQIYLTMRYEDSKNGVNIERETDMKAISVYQAPDVKKIFGFKEPAEGSEIKHEEICVGKSPESVRFNVDTLAYYQYKLATGNFPYYISPTNNRGMEIHYFYTDTLYDNMPESAWREVTGRSDTVSVSQNIIFFESGYYKMMITAQNTCNQFREGGAVDTLWTDRISWNEDARRYFQVYSNDSMKVECKTERLCTNVSDELVFVDYNVRRGFEAPPTYRIVNENVGAGVELPFSVDIYRNGVIVDGDAAMKCGCDSTILRVSMGKRFYGTANLTFYRQGACEEMSRTFRVKIGREPDIHLARLNRSLTDKYDASFNGRYYRICDTFRYQLPIDSLVLPDWSRGYDLDSVTAVIKQGMGAEQHLVFRSGDTFYPKQLLDSTDVYTTIYLRSYNYCGMDDATLKLRVNAKPKVKLLRDSLPKNDSLCVGFDYPYYWGGQLPKDYTISFKPSSPVFVNGVRHEATQMQIENGDKIRLVDGGMQQEEFIIQNDSMVSCKLDAVWPVVGLTPPDTLIFPDSVSYCESLTTLQTVKLFAEGKSDFKWGTWKLNNEAEVKERLPEIPMTVIEGVDTLRYKLSRSKGCYVQGEVLLRPQTVPELKLREEAHYCLPQEELVFRKDLGLLENELVWNGRDSLTVYQNKISPNLVKYNDAATHANDLNYSLSATDNGGQFIYDLVNRRVSPVFMDRCRVVDTVKLRVSSPKVNILKADTLKYPWGKYDFSRLKDKGFVDTAQVDATTLQWTLRPEGTLCGTRGQLYAGSYTLTSADQAKDTLLFELSARNYCGDLLKDTLRVELIKLKALGYEDIICSNTKEYPLWDKVKASHVNLDAVEWSIGPATGSTGTLSGTTGSDVTYTPAGDTRHMTIQFTAALEGAPEVKVTQNIELTVNPAPVFKITKDTLWACGKRVDFDKISSFHKVNVESVGKGDWVSEPGKKSLGGWSGNDYTFEDIMLEKYGADIFQKVSYKAKALPGCKDVLDTVVLAQPVPAAVNFKRLSEDMCAGDRIKLDTLYDLSGEDAFVKYDWQLGNNAAGHFEDNYRYYVASWPQDSIQALKVTTYKEYTCYTGNSSGMVLRSNEITLPLTVHRQPEFRVVHKWDTLCNTQTEIDILRDWVSVDRSVYPDYQDSVKIDGLPFRADGFPKWTVNDIGEQKLVVTVSQGRCTKWKDKRDTIYLYRLEKMSNGLFSVPNVCEGARAEIDKSRLVNSPLAGQKVWSAVGGRLTDNDCYFVPDEHVEQGTVTLTVTPPHGCPAESYTSPVQIGKKPQLKNSAYTVCALTGHTQDIYTELTDPAVQVQSIEWMRSDAPDDVIATTNAADRLWTFTVTDADLQQTGGVELIARIKSVGVCQGTFENTVRLTWQKPQEYAVRQTPEICQADPVGIDLRTMVDVMYSGPLVWSMTGTDLGALEGSLFKPADQSGTANVVVTLPGLNGCPERVETLPVTVNPAPLSDIKPEGEPCTGREVKLRPENARTQRYDWEFGDGGRVSGSGAAPVKHTYANPGDYTIKMTSHFANGCTREETKPWTVNPTPEALFTLPDPAPIDKPVDLVSLSRPETVTCDWLVDDATSYNGQSVSHVFGNAGSHTVRLVATAPEGCRDTIWRSTTVLDKPVANFSVEVDSCAGRVRITNLSTRNGAAVAWDFGNGESVSSSWDPAEKSYPLVYRDTTYTIRLTLANVSDTVEYTKSFKMISKLQPGFELWETGPCNKTEKEIHIQTRGKADTTVVDWGDGSTPDRWDLSDYPISVLRHRYPVNATTSPLGYTIRLRAVNACHRLDKEEEVSVLPQQVQAKVLEADELPEFANPCYGNDRGFWNKSFGFISRGYTCEWDFGDGTPLQSDTVSIRPKAHMFARPGEYTVRLRVKDECNEVLDSVKVTAHGNDSLSFVFDKDKERLCTGDSVRISFVQRGKEPFTNLRWTLPDGSHESNVETIYWKFKNTDAGTGRVSLSAEADGCRENPRVQEFFVQQTPDPMIDLSGIKADTCTSVSMRFRVANRNGNTNNILTFWNFGNGSTSTEVIPPAMAFDSAGRYMVKVSMTSSNGCVGWDSVPVTARVTPATKFELDRRLVCSNDGNFEIAAFNRTPLPDSCTFEWYKGNDVVSMDPVGVTVPFAGFHGREAITLRAVHQRTRCERRISDTIVASWPLKAGLSVSPDTVCSGMEVIFTDTSTTAGTTRRFLFDDGSFAEERETSKTYWEAGKYVYDFILTNADGCADTIRDTVYVHTLPSVDFDWKKDNMITGVEILPDPEVESGGIRFTNTSFIDLLDWEKEGLRYHWDFGDGETSEEKEPAHQYDNNGTYEVWLHAISRMGCRDSLSRLIDIAAIKGLYFPNAMIPASGDPGVNRFQPKGIGLSAFTLKVYAPDGTCVWQTDKLDNGRPAEYWDGTFNGQVVPPGVYNWEATALFIDGTVQNHLNGPLIVIR